MKILVYLLRGGEQCSPITIEEYVSYNEKREEKKHLEECLVFWRQKQDHAIGSLIGGIIPGLLISALLIFGMPNSDESVLDNSLKFLIYLASISTLMYGLFFIYNARESGYFIWCSWIFMILLIGIVLFVAVIAGIPYFFYLIYKAIESRKQIKIIEEQLQEL